MDSGRAEFGVDINARLTGEDQVLKEGERLGQDLQSMLSQNLQPVVDLGRSTSRRGFVVKPVAPPRQVYETAARIAPMPVSVTPDQTRVPVHVDRRALASAVEGAKKFLPEYTPKTIWKRENKKQIVEAVGVRGILNDLEALGQESIDTAQAVDKLGSTLDGARKAADNMAASQRGSARTAATLTPIVSKSDKQNEAITVDWLSRTFSRNGRGLNFSTLLGQHGSDASITAWGAGRRLFSGIELKSRGIEGEVFDKMDQDIKFQSGRANVNELLTYGKFNTMGVSILDPTDMTSVSGAFVADPKIMREYALGEYKYKQTSRTSAQRKAEDKDFASNFKVQGLDADTRARAGGVFREAIVNTLSDENQALDETVIPKILNELDKATKQDRQILLDMANSKLSEMKKAKSTSKEGKALAKLGLSSVESFTTLDENAIKALAFGFETASPEIKIRDLASRMFKRIGEGPADLVQKQYKAFTNQIIDDLSQLDKGLSKELQGIFDGLGEDLVDPSVIYKAIRTVLQNEDGTDKDIPESIRKRLEGVLGVIGQAYETIDKNAGEEARRIQQDIAALEDQDAKRRGTKGRGSTSAASVLRGERLSLTGEDLGAVGTALTMGVWAEQAGRFDNEEEVPTRGRRRRIRRRRPSAQAAAQQARREAEEIAESSMEATQGVAGIAQDLAQGSATLDATVAALPEIEIKDDINRATAALERIGESFSAAENNIKNKADEVEEAAKRAGQLGVGLTKDTAASRANAAVDPNARAAMKRARIDVGEAPLGITQSDQQQRKGINLNGFGMFAMAGGGGEGSPLGGALSQLSELPGMILKGLSILLAGSNVFVVAIVAIAAILFAISRKYGGLGKALKLLAGRIRGQTSTGDDPDPDSISAPVERAKPPRLGWLRSFADQFRMGPAPGQNMGFAQMYTGSAEDLTKQAKQIQKDLLKIYHPDRVQNPQDKSNYNEIGRHIGELTSSLRLSDLEDLRAVRNDPEKFLETINRQLSAMGRPILKASTEAASSISKAGTAVSSELRETATEIDSASDKVTGSITKTASDIKEAVSEPIQEARTRTKTVDEIMAERGANSQAQAKAIMDKVDANRIYRDGLHGQFRHIDPIISDEEYQLNDSKRTKQRNWNTLYGADGMKHLERLFALREAWNPSTAPEELREKFKQNYDFVNKAFKEGKFDKMYQVELDPKIAASMIQPFTEVVETVERAVQPLKEAGPEMVEVAQKALVPVRQAGPEMVEVTEKALVPLRQAGPQVVEAAEKALVPLRQAGLMLQKKVQKIDTNENLPQLPAGTEQENKPAVVRRRVRPRVAPKAEVVDGEYREVDETDSPPPKKKPRVECPDPCPDPCPCKEMKGKGKRRQDDDDDADGGGDGGDKPPTAGGTMPGGTEPPVGPVNRYIAALERVVNYLQEWQQRLSRLGNFLQQFANQIGQFRNTINQAFQQAKQYVSQFAQFAQQGLSRLGTVVDNVGKKFAGFGQRVRNGFESAKESAATLYFLSSTMTQAGSKLSSFGKQQLQKANQFFNEYSGYEMAANRLSVSAGVGGYNEDGTVNTERGFQMAQDFVFGMQRGEFKAASGEGIFVDAYNAEQLAQAAYYYQSAAGTPAGGQSMLATKQGQQAMAQILGPILNMAAATQTNPEEYIKGVVNIAQQFGYDPSKGENAAVMGNIANVVGQIANVTTLEIPDILETFKYVGPQLNMLAGGQAGAGLGDALMLVEMASRAGIKGSMAGTGIGQIVSTFVDVPEAVAESVAPLLGLGNLQDGEAVAAFEAKFQTKDGKLDGGILGAISKIVESTSGEPQEVAKVLSKIFTQNATRASSAIAAQIVKASSSQEFLDAAAAYDAGDFKKANMLYEEAMAKTSDTVTASVQRVRNAIFQLKATMFDAVKTPLKGYLNDLANIFFELADALESNPFISKLIAGLTGVISIVATVLGALLTMGGTLFMIQRSFIMAGGSISLFFGILSTVAAGFFTMIPVILLAGAAIAILAGHLQKTGTTFDEFFANLRGDFGEGLGQKLQDFSLKAVKALELVTFAFYEFVNTILMGNDVGSNFLGSLLGKVFGPEAAGIILGMFNKVSSGLTGFREDVNKEVDDVQGKFESLKNIPSLFKGLGQAFATGRVDVSDAFGINQLGESFGFGSSGLQAIVVEAANQIWVAISEIWAIFQYFKGQFIATFDQMRDATGTAIDTAPFMQFLVLIRTITVGIVAGFLAALLAATQAVAGLVSRLNGLSEGNSKIQELTYNVTGLTLTLEKLGTILGFVFGAAMAGRMIMMIQPIGQLAVHFAKIGIVAGQVGVAIGKTVAMFALQAAQFVVNIGLLALQAAAYAAYIGIQIISTGIGLAVAAVSTIVALAKTQEAGATLSSAFAALSAASAFTILKIVLMAVVAVVLILVGIYFILIASLIIAALGIIAIIAATEGLRAAFDAVVGFVMSFIDAMRDVINLLKGVYNWAMGFLMAASGASTLAGTLKEIGMALAWMIGLPLAGLFVVIVAVAGAAVGLVRGMLAIGRVVKNSDIFKSMINGLKTLFSGIGRLGAALWPLIKIIAILNLVMVGPMVIAFKIVGVFLGHVIGLIGNVIKNTAKMIEWFTMAFRAFANGDWIQGFKLLGNVVGQFFFGIVERVVDAIHGMADAFLAGVDLILDAASSIPFIGDEAARARNALKGFRDDLEKFKNDALGWVEEKLTFTIDAEYDINLSDEERRRAMGILTEIEQLEVVVPVKVEVFVDNPTLMGPNGVPLQESYMTDGLDRRAVRADLAYNEFEEGLRQGLYTVLVEYRDAETGELITSMEQGQPLEVFDKGGNATTIYRRADDASTKDINEEGYVANIDGTYMYVNLRRRKGGGLTFDVDQDAGEFGDGRVFISNGDRIIRSVEERRAARDAAFEENAEGQMFGGIFSDATDWVSKYIGENDSLQSLFGFANIDAANLRDGDLGRALTPQEIKAMMDATDQSPRAKELLAPYLDDAYAQSEIYDDLYWERERLTAEFEAGIISEEEYLHRLIQITKQMNEAAVTAESLATENERLLKAEEDRLKLANEFTEAFGKALTEGFATWENYILGSIARVNAAISTANELIIGNSDKIDEALAASGDQFFYRDPYTGAYASRPYTTEEMLMSVGGFSQWNPLEDGPLDYWLMNDPDNQAWRDSMIYQGKNPADIAKVAAGDNRWGANTGLRDMVVGEMMTGLNPGALDSLNRSYLDYRDIASYASMMMASGQDFNLGTYLMDSGQMFMQDGVWTDINSENLDEALAWMNEEYGITLTVDTITDDTFEDLRGLIFDDKGQIVAATGEFMANLPKIVEGAFGKIAVMDEEEFAKLDNATKAYLNAAGVTIVTATTEEMNRYSLDVTKQIPQIINEGIDLKFDDLNQDGLVDAYFIDPATGTATDVSHSALLRNNLYDAAGADYSLSDAERAGLIQELTGDGGLFENYEGDLNPIIDTLLPWLDAQKIAAEEARLANEAQVDATSDGVAAGIEDSRDVLYQATRSATFDALTDYYGPSKNMTPDARDLLDNILKFPNANGGRSGPSVGAVNPENAPIATTWGEIEELRREALEARSLTGEEAARIARERVQELERGVRADGSPAVLPYDYDKFFGGGRNPGNFDVTPVDGSPAVLPYDYDKFFGGGRNPGNFDLSSPTATDQEINDAFRRSIMSYIRDFSGISVTGISDIFGQAEGDELWNNLFNLDYNRGLDEQGNVVSWADEKTTKSLNSILDLFADSSLTVDNPNLGAMENFSQDGGYLVSSLGTFTDGAVPVVIENAAGEDGILSVGEIIEGVDLAKIMRENPELTFEQAQAQAESFVQALVDTGIVTDGSDLEEALTADIKTQAEGIVNTLLTSLTDWSSIVSSLDISATDFRKIADDNGMSATALINGSGDLLIAASALATASGQISIATANAAAITASGGAVDGRQKGPHASGGRVTTPFQLVGELGRELVSLPMGSRVFSASQTENILAEAFKPSVNMMAATVEMPNSIQMETDSRSSQSSGGDTIVVNFNGDMNIRDQRDIELLVDEIDRELGRRSQNAKRGMMGTSRSVSVD